MARRHRPLFPPLRPRRNQYAPMSSEQAPYHSLRRKRQSSHIPLLLLFQPNPLRWASSGLGNGTKVRASDHSTRLTIKGKLTCSATPLLRTNPLQWALPGVGKRYHHSSMGRGRTIKTTTIVLRGFSSANGRRESISSGGAGSPAGVKAMENQTFSGAG